MRTLLHTFFFNELVRLDDVTLLDVGVGERQTALVTVADLGDVVLLALQRRDADRFGHHDVVAQQPGLGVAPDDTGGDEAAGDVADLRRPEDRPDLGAAEFLLLVDRLEHALQGCLDLVDRLVDHRVVPDVDTLAVGQLGGLALRPDVEPDDDRVRGRRQIDVGLGDATDAAVDDAQFDLVADVDAQQGFLQRLYGAGVVALQDQVQLAGFLQRGIEVVEADALAGACRQCIALARAAPVGDLTGDPVLVDDEQVVTGTRHRREADDLDWTRRGCLLDVLTVFVDHPSHAPIGVAGDDRVADPQRSARNEHGRDGPTATVQVRFDSD